VPASVGRRAAPEPLEVAVPRSPGASPRPVTSSAGVPVASLPAGPVEYVDTGGPGPVLVFTHGLLMDSAEWAEVVAALSPGHRCIAPTFPVGAHRRPMTAGADLSQTGLAALLAEFLAALDLHDVTLVVNDLGYPLALAADGDPRVSALVLTPCEAFDNVPPGLPGAVVSLAARVPGGLLAAVASLAVPGADRLPFTLGRMSRRPLPRSLVRRWTTPARRSSRIRADLRGYVRTANAEWQATTTERLRHFRGRSLVCWTDDDLVMPAAHGPRLRDLLRAELVVVPGARTLLPLDAPQELARAIAGFVAAAPADAP
jgi:pimeloyl-ACP methyl ester carboxylesterase